VRWLRLRLHEVLRLHKVLVHVRRRISLRGFGLEKVRPLLFLICGNELF
jgi:hypothetical protein